PAFFSGTGFRMFSRPTRLLAAVCVADIFAGRGHPVTSSTIATRMRKFPQAEVEGARRRAQRTHRRWLWLKNTLQRIGTGASPNDTASRATQPPCRQDRAAYLRLI